MQREVAFHVFLQIHVVIWMKKNQIDTVSVAVTQSITDAPHHTTMLYKSRCDPPPKHMH